MGAVDAGNPGNKNGPGVGGNRPEPTVQRSLQGISNAGGYTSATDVAPELSAIALLIATHRELEAAERASLQAFDRAEHALFRSLEEQPAGLPAGLHLSRADWRVVVDRNERGLPVLRVSQQIALAAEIERASAIIEARVETYRVRPLEAAWHADADRLHASLDAILLVRPASFDEEAMRITFLAENDRYEGLNSQDWKILAASLRG